MKKVPLVSIIIPCYGVEKYLDRCMASVVNQSVKDIEIILVDDGSPDKVPLMCDEWAKKESRIKVIHKANGGLGFARNTGLDIATGKYVIFLDSDDFIDQNMVLRLIESTENGKYDVVFCGLKQQLKSGQEKLVHDFDKITVFKKKKIELLSLSFLQKTELNQNERLFMSVWHALYRRDLIERHHLRFYSEREILSEDLPFQVEFVKNSEFVKFIPDYLYTYCFNSSSLTHNFRISKFNSAVNLRNLMLNVAPNTSDTIPFIDAEFYGRIRSLLTSLISADNFTLCEKFSYVKELCKYDIWKDLSTQHIYYGRSWKYVTQYRLLVSKMPLLLFLFIYFDKYVNKQKLLSFLKKR